MIDRTIIIVLDSFGVGQTPDAPEFDDEVSNTFANIYKATNCKLPNMKKLGLFNIQDIGIDDKEQLPIGIYGKAAEKARGKNSPVGHWEIAGYIKDKPFSVYYDGFPQVLLDEISEKAGIPGFLYNQRGSGTDLLRQYGEESVKTGKPIVYTSVDSVFQIAAHEEVIPVPELYRICQIARSVCDEKGYNIGTIIARPFLGTCNEDYARTYNRKDFEAQDFGKTMLDVFEENGKSVLAIGKIEDLFTGRGIKRAIHTEGNTDGIHKTIEEIKNASEDMIFVNLVDFDMLYGHRNNVEGYAKALEEFDSYVPEIIDALHDDDVLIITADHGNDPTTPSTDHNREYIPIVMFGKNLKRDVDIGIRDTYSDISATILDMYGLPKLDNGVSFKDLIEKKFLEI